MRDEHAVESHLAQVKEICAQGGWDETLDLASHSIVLPYDTLLTLVSVSHNTLLILVSIFF